MTLLDFIQLGIIKKNRTAQAFAEDLVDRWHKDQVPGQLRDVLGLTPREYQAWTTGGVSLLTIARWRNEGPPPLDPKKPWFKLAGRRPAAAGKCWLFGREVGDDRTEKASSSP